MPAAPAGAGCARRALVLRAPRCGARGHPRTGVVTVRHPTPAIAPLRASSAHTDRLEGSCASSSPDAGVDASGLPGLGLGDRRISLHEHVRVVCWGSPGFPRSDRVLPKLQQSAVGSDSVDRPRCSRRGLHDLRVARDPESGVGGRLVHLPGLASLPVELQQPAVDRTGVDRPRRTRRSCTICGFPAIRAPPVSEEKCRIGGDSAPSRTGLVTSAGPGHRGNAGDQTGAAAARSPTPFGAT